MQLSNCSQIKKLITKEYLQPLDVGGQIPRHGLKSTIRAVDRGRGAGTRLGALEQRRLGDDRSPDDWLSADPRNLHIIFAIAVGSYETAAQQTHKHVTPQFETKREPIWPGFEHGRVFTAN